MSGSYCSTWRKDQPPLASPCPSLQETALQPSQALRPPACTLTMMVTHLSSHSTSDCPAGAKGHVPIPRQGLPEQTGITQGDTWSAQEGGEGPPHSGKPATTLHNCVRIHWSRKVFGFTVALDQGGWKDGFRPTAPNCPYRTVEVPEFHSVRSKSLLGL